MIFKCKPPKTYPPAEMGPTDFFMHNCTIAEEKVKKLEKAIREALQHLAPPTAGHPIYDTYFSEPDVVAKICEILRTAIGTDTPT